MKKNGEKEKKNAYVAVKWGVSVRRNCTVFKLAMDNVLIGKIRDQLSRHHTQMHFKSNEMYTFLNHFQICEIVDMIDRFPVYIQTMQSCSSMFDTSSHSFQRQDDQDVHAIPCVHNRK